MSERTERIYTERCKPTNAEVIRYMTDEELADLLYRVETCRIMTNDWIEWLRTPAEKGEQKV